MPLPPGQPGLEQRPAPPLRTELKCTAAISPAGASPAEAPPGPCRLLLPRFSPPPPTLPRLHACAPGSPLLPAFYAMCELPVVPAAAPTPPHPNPNPTPLQTLTQHPPPPCRYYLLGWGFAGLAVGDGNPFIGDSQFALKDLDPT